MSYSKKNQSNKNLYIVGGVTFLVTAIASYFAVPFLKEKFKKKTDDKQQAGKPTPDTGDKL